MNNLSIDFGSCVRVFSKNSTCTFCRDICPKNAIFYNENIPVISSECIDCGGCIGVCPDEAISLKNFNTIDFIFSYLKDKNPLISCKKNIPCLALLSVENLITLALLKDKTVLDIGHCESCDIKDPLYKQISDNIKEANIFLSSVETDKQIAIKEIRFIDEKKDIKSLNQDRRAFLKRFTTKGTTESKIEFQNSLKRDKNSFLNQKDSENIRKKEIPDKRKLLLLALDKVEHPKNYLLFMPDKLSFVSQKYIDSSCDNCSICYRICPSGALTSDKYGSKIFFEPTSCIKCSLCHDVCEKKSLSLISFSTKEFFEPKKYELISFKRTRCTECTNFFTYLGGETICPRCKIEEEEAKNLWKIT